MLWQLSEPFLQVKKPTVSEASLSDSNHPRHIAWGTEILKLTTYGI
jgi:hypothetical protein